MPYSLKLRPRAYRALQNLPASTKRRIEDALDELEQDPYRLGSIKLEGGRGLRRYRVGEYRVVYSVDDAGHLVIVLRIAHRRDVYRDLDL